MIILQWSVLLLLSLEIRNVRSSYFNICLPFKSCEVSVDIKPQDEKAPDFNPLYLVGKSGSYELAIPRVTDNDDSTVVRVFFPNKKKLIYACPKNIKTHLRDKVNPELSQQKDITMPSKPEELINEHCNQKVEPIVKTLKTLCSGSESSDDADKFFLYEVGFKVFVRYDSKMSLIFKFITRSQDKEQRTVETWHPLYKTCHNPKTRASLYTIHTLHGGSVGSKKPSFTGNFRDVSNIDGTEETIDTKSISLDDIYTQTSVQELFGNMFDNRTKESKYANKDFLAKGHLVPDADMAFIPWKYATYLFLNAVPMWQYLNNSSWKSIETQIRKHVNQSNQKFTIYTGTHKILSYKGQSIFLGGENSDILPVPLFLWKVVHDEQKNEAIAFIVVNDPYTTLEEKDFLCPPNDKGQEICSEYKWYVYSNKQDDNNPSKRKIAHCCTVKELHEKVPHAPDLSNAKILQFDFKNVDKR
ncbi:uncharacterized protein LOC135840541 [Planococcus citri]|uniref:uncharacterized protein LOC135840541 n=1 Tax=Planococcus citri TaxID=170843 RepID=UPI0031F887D0